MSIADRDLDEDELATVAAHLTRAAGPEDVFGDLPGSPAEQLTQLRRQYRRLAMAVHPDRHANDPLAHLAFVALQRLYAEACQRVQAGRYGQLDPTPGAVTIATRRHTYTVGEPFAEGDVATLYTCTIASQQGSTPGTVPGILKVARDARDNDLLANEATALRLLQVPLDDSPVPAYIPRLLESFLYEDAAGIARQVNAFPLVVAERGPLPVTELYTLREIRQQYPDGIDPKQMAWMWRRLLIALGHAHERDLVHGAVLPPHILIHPEAHGLLLVDWCASVRQPRLRGERISLISAEYEAWYPRSVLTKAIPTPAVDVEMGLRCMVDLLGGDPLRGTLPPSLPAPLRAYLLGALQSGASQTDAYRLYRDFSDLLASLWGKRRFVPFSMPPRR